MKLSEYIEKYGDCEVTCEIDKCIVKMPKKEIPKMPAYIQRGNFSKHGYCPNCGGFVMQTFKDTRCGVCGQVLKWEEEDD